MMDERVTVTATPVSQPAKKPRTKANACSECGTADKFAVAGHTQAGWCPVRQRYGCKSQAAKRLKTLEQQAAGNPYAEADPDAEALIEAVQTGNGQAVQKLLIKHEELILLPVKKSHWTWSLLHEAASKIEPADGLDAPAVKVFCYLLRFCTDEKDRQMHLDYTLPKMTSSGATIAHQLAYRGNKTALAKLIAAGGNLFARTRSGWLPIHNALKQASPAYQDASFARWLFTQMKELGQDVSCLATPPEGFTAEHGCDLERLAELVQA